MDPEEEVVMDLLEAAMVHEAVVEAMIVTVVAARPDTVAAAVEEVEIVACRETGETATNFNKKTTMCQQKMHEVVVVVVVDGEEAVAVVAEEDGDLIPINASAWKKAEAINITTTNTRNRMKVVMTITIITIILLLTAVEDGGVEEAGAADSEDGAFAVAAGLVAAAAVRQVLDRYMW